MHWGGFRPRCLLHCCRSWFFAAFEGMKLQRWTQTFRALTERPLKALLTAWSLFYGEVSEGPRGLRIRVPIPGRKNHIAQVIRTSSVTLDGILRELKTAENWEREGDFVTFNASTLQSVHEWMRHAEGKDAYLARPARVEDMLLAAQAEAAEIIH